MPAIALAEGAVLDSTVCGQFFLFPVEHVPDADVVHVPDADVNLTPEISPPLIFEIPITIDLADRLNLTLPQGITELETGIGMLRYAGGTLYFNGQPLDDTKTKLEILCGMDDDPDSKD